MRYIIEYKPDNLKGTNRFLELVIHREDDSPVSNEELKKVIEEHNIKGYQIINIFKEERCPKCNGYGVVVERIDKGKVLNG